MRLHPSLSIGWVSWGYRSQCLPGTEAARAARAARAEAARAEAVRANSEAFRASRAAREARAEAVRAAAEADQAEADPVQCLNPSGCLSFVLVSESAEHRAADDWA